MKSREPALHTRRSILGMALSALAAGCATASSQVAPASAAGGGFPAARQWCWDRNWTTPAPLDRLGQIIMQARNPYCAHPSSGTTSCVANDSKTWPQQLTDETTWKVLTEFDFRSRDGQAWQFGGSTVSPSRSMRIPYLIKQTKAKKKVAGIPLEIGRENLLVGYEDNNESVAGATLWGAPANCSGPGDSVGELARFIVENMMFDGHDAGFYMPNWAMQGNGWGYLEDGSTNKACYFRQATIFVDFLFRIPIASGTGTTAQQAGWIYVGYEGGGSY